MFMPNLCHVLRLTKSRTGEILKGYTPKELHAADISPEMISILRKKDWPIKAEIMDAQELTYPDDYFTHVYMSMGIFLLPDAEKGASEIYRVLKPGGSAIITSIKKVGWVKLFQEAQEKAAIQKPLWKGPLKEEWYTKEKLHDVLSAGGFKDIKITNSETVQPGSMIEKFVKSMRETVTKGITERWAEDEKQRFEAATDEVLKKELENPRDMEVLAYVAVVKK
jgi:ubiquinone/menaquinone biosynthesis C-methylase UbiE